MKMECGCTLCGNMEGIFFDESLQCELTRVDFCAFGESNLIALGTRRSTYLLRALTAPISKMDRREFSVSCRSNFRTKHRR